MKLANKKEILVECLAVQIIYTVDTYTRWWLQLFFLPIFCRRYVSTCQARILLEMSYLWSHVVCIFLNQLICFGETLYGPHSPLCLPLTLLVLTVRKNRLYVVMTSVWPEVIDGFLWYFIWNILLEATPPPNKTMHFSPRE